MLLRFLSFLFAVVICVVLVVGQDLAPPEILAAGPDSFLEPLAGRPADVTDEAVDESKVIRGLLGRRQTTCATNYFACGPGCVEYHLSRVMLTMIKGVAQLEAIVVLVKVSLSIASLTSMSSSLDFLARVLSR